MTTTHSAFPLEWPVGRPRRDIHRRKVSQFRDLGFGKCRDDLLRALKRFGAKGVTLSTDVPLRLDGLPYSNMRAPDDPGVAVYFHLEELAQGKWVRREYAIACDQYRKVSENLRALVHTIDAMHTIHRHGSSELLEQAMSGFAALPPPADPSSWWAALGFMSMPTLERAKTRWRELVAKSHPDVGGSHEEMQKLNDAIARAERDLG